MSTGLAVKPTSEDRLEQEVIESVSPEPAALDRADEKLTQDEQEAAVMATFEELADELEEAAAGMSSTRRAISNPAFIEILTLGDAVIPRIIRRLDNSANRPLWLRMLGTFTSYPPGAGQETIDEAAQAWIAWGRHNF